MPSDAPDLLQRHPPERRQRQARGVMLYSCCCCCCCCLHSFGAALGAALGGNYRGGTNPFADAKGTAVPRLGSPRPHVLKEPLEESPRQLPSTQGLYWTSLLIAILLSLGATIAWMLLEPSGAFAGRTDVSQVPTVLLGLGFIFILTAPAWFLAAIPIMALRIAIRKDVRSDSRYWWGLGRITLGVVLGTLAGIAAMFVMILPFMGR